MIVFSMHFNIRKKIISCKIEKFVDIIDERKYETR